MSSSGAETDLVCCANCGVGEVDEIKLEECDGCDLVLCGSDNCKDDHREQHDEECQKRAQELHDKELFRQPERSHDDDLFRQPDGNYRGECPLCFLPMPLHPLKCAFWSCCSTWICDGCCYAHFESNGGDRCAFCRE